MPEESDYEQHEKWRKTMHCFIRDANEHFKNHQQGTVVSILTTLASGILASNALKVPVWESTAFGLLVLVILSAWSAWSESRRKLENLTDIIRQQDKTADLQNAIAVWLAKGNHLLYRSYKESGAEAFRNECKQWDEGTAAYLRSNLNDLAATTFSHPDPSYYDSEIANKVSRRITAQVKSLKSIAEGIAVFIRPLSPNSIKQ